MVPPSSFDQRWSKDEEEKRMSSQRLQQVVTEYFAALRANDAE